MQTILITGATGFVGSHILESVAGLPDVRIIAACRDRRRLFAGYDGEVREGDLRDPTYVQSLCDGVHTVCHAAAWTSLYKHRRKSHELFLEPAIRLVDAAAAAGVKRFLNVSTTSAASPDASSDAMSRGICRPYWPHLCNVVALEDHLRDKASDAFSVVNLRLGLFAGRRYGIGLLPILLPRLKTHLVPWVAGGRTSMPIIDGRDIGQAFLCAIQAGGLGAYESFNIVGPEVPTERQVIEFINCEFGYPKPHFSVPFPIAFAFAWLMEAIDPLVPWEPLVTRSIIHLLREVQADNARAERMLDYKPEYLWQDTVRVHFDEMKIRQQGPMSMARPIEGIHTNNEKQLQQGDRLDAFEWEAINGETVKFDDYPGRYLLLSFYRYASCPLCNMRVHELSRRYQEFNDSGLDMIGVFQSPKDKLLQYITRQTPAFPIIADPGCNLYKAFGLESSWWGLTKAWITRFPRVMEAFGSKQFFPGTIEGDIHRLPADILVGPDGVVLEAYYGKDIGDHIPIETLNRRLRGSNL